MKISRNNNFFINSALKTNRWTFKIKDLNREKITGGFYEKELWIMNKLLSRTRQSY